LKHFSLYTLRISRLTHRRDDGKFSPLVLIGEKTLSAP